MPPWTAGEPTQMIAKLSTFLEQTRLGIVALWGNGGTVRGPRRGEQTRCWRLWERSYAVATSRGRPPRFIPQRRGSGGARTWCSAHTE